MVRTTISPTELQSKTREILERVQAGELAVVERDGREQVILQDAVDHLLLRGLAATVLHEEPQQEANSLAAPRVGHVLAEYLAERISLSKAAELGPAL